MRFRISYRSYTPRFCLVWLLTSIALIGGCGGSSNRSNTPAPTTTRAKVTIRWEEPSRAIISPVTAQSAHITLVKGGLDGQDIVIVANRRTDPASYQETYPAPVESPIGEVEVQVRFHSQRDAKGLVVGTATARVPLKADGHISEIVTQAVHHQVEIPWGQSVAIGQPKPLVYVVRKNGNIIAFPPEDVAIAVIEGTDVLRVVEGRLEGIKPGTARVSATLEGHLATTYVDVAHPGGVTITPGGVTLPLAQHQSFAATVAGAPSNSVVWAIEEGEVGGTITTGGYYRASENPGTYHISATSTFDPSQKAIVVVNVQAGGISIGID